MADDTPSKKLADLDGPRAAARLLKHCQQIDAEWSDTRKRQGLLSELSSTLKELEHASVDLAPQIFRLRTLIQADMSRAEFWTLMVPIERAYNRQHLTDADFIECQDDDALTPATFPLSLVLYNLRSAFNIGGIIRLAECVGAEHIHLVGYTAGVDHPKVKHAAMGCDARLDIHTHATLEGCLQALRASGCRFIAGLETAKESVPPADAAWQWPAALVVGNERFGIESSELARMDATLRVPVYGSKNSLNVVSALSVVSYAAREKWNG